MSTLYPPEFSSRLVKAGAVTVKGEYVPNAGNLAEIGAVTDELVSAGLAVSPSTLREAWLAAESTRLAVLARSRLLG